MLSRSDPARTSRSTCSRAARQGRAGGVEEGHPLGAAWDTEERRADVLVVRSRRQEREDFATGLRNCSGHGDSARHRAPWCVVNERDELGDNTPFEYATEVKEGRSTAGPGTTSAATRTRARRRAARSARTRSTVPDVLIQAHSAPLQIVFYEGDEFPAEYRGGAFVTLHGSWNRGQRTGYKVVRLPFKDGKPTGEYEDFMTGFVVGRQAGVGPAGRRRGREGRLADRHRRWQRDDLARDASAAGGKVDAPHETTTICRAGKGAQRRVRRDS